MEAKEYSEKLDKSINSKAKTKKMGIYAAFLILVIASALYFTPKVIFALNHETTDNAFVKGSVIPVSAMVKGRISTVYIEDNMTVAKGDKLFELEKDEYIIAFDKAQQELEAALAQIVKIDAAIAQTGKSIEQSQSLLNKVKTEENFAVKEQQRYSKLAEENLVSSNYYDSIKAKADEINAQKKASEVSVEMAESALKTNQAERKMAEFKAESARQAVKQAELNLNRTTVYAPADGRIGQNNVKEGRYVQPGQSVIMLVNDTDLWIEANYKETQMENIRVGQSVEIKVDAFPNSKITGHVESIQPGTGSAFSLLPAENATGNFVKVVQRVPVKILVDGIEGDTLLVPGLSVEPSIKVK
jgi:membrane fusion protein (multidrug efflux system)